MARKRYCYDYPRPMVTVDAVVLRLRDGVPEVLLVKRGSPPHRGRWALPGGFIRMNEPLENAVAREVAEETNLTEIPFLVQLGAYGEPGRDPRGRVISVAFIAIINDPSIEPRAGSDAGDAVWAPLGRLPGSLAFDHHRILSDALERVLTGATYSGVLFAFLPDPFAERHVQEVLDAFFEEKIPARRYLDYFLEAGMIRKAGRGKFRFKLS